MNRIPQNTTDRFWGKAEKTEACWLWTAAHDRKGYGKFSVGSARNSDGSRRNSMVSAHRFSYEMAYGDIQKGDGYHGICVLHRCDTPSCVRPDHLFLGTNSDNVHDMDTKGRRINKQPCGSKHGNAVLTEENVRAIFGRHKIDGVTQIQLSREYGVCHSTINHIFTGRLWGHLGLTQSQNR
jgi:hypothetical protein